MTIDPSDKTLNVYSRKEALSGFVTSLMYASVGNIIMAIGYTILICSGSAFWRHDKPDTLGKCFLTWTYDILSPIKYCITIVLLMICQLVSIFIYPLEKDNISNLTMIIDDSHKSLDARFSPSDRSE